MILKTSYHLSNSEKDVGFSCPLFLAQLFVTYIGPALENVSAKKMISSQFHKLYVPFYFLWLQYLSLIFGPYIKQKMISSQFYQWYLLLDCAWKYNHCHHHHNLSWEMWQAVKTPIIRIKLILGLALQSLKYFVVVPPSSSYRVVLHTQSNPSNPFLYSLGCYIHLRWCFVSSW